MGRSNAFGAGSPPQISSPGSQLGHLVARAQVNEITAQTTERRTCAPRRHRRGCPPTQQRKYATPTKYLGQDGTATDSDAAAHAHAPPRAHGAPDHTATASRLQAPAAGCISDHAAAASGHAQAAKNAAAAQHQTQQILSAGQRYSRSQGRPQAGRCRGPRRRRGPARALVEVLDRRRRMQNAEVPRGAPANGSGALETRQAAHEAVHGHPGAPARGGGRTGDEDARDLAAAVRVLPLRPGARPVVTS